MHVFLFSVLAFLIAVYLLNKLSYVLLKTRIFGRRTWDLNICCGKTDGGGVNADIVKHRADLPNFQQIDDIYQLPFRNEQFECVLCSHTMEHVDDPARFDRELRRVGKEVHYIVPPLWDLGAVFNVREHKWIFLTWKKEHTRLPNFIVLPFSKTVQKHLAQRISA